MEHRVAPMWALACGSTNLAVAHHHCLPIVVQQRVQSYRKIPQCRRSTLPPDCLPQHLPPQYFKRPVSLHHPGRLLFLPPVPILPCTMAGVLYHPWAPIPPLFSRYFIFDLFTRIVPITKVLLKADAAAATTKCF